MEQSVSGKGVVRGKKVQMVGEVEPKCGRAGQRRAELGRAVKACAFSFLPLALLPSLTINALHLSLSMFFFYYY